jgi:hypothetical protein
MILKKFNIAFLLLASMCLSIAGCGDKSVNQSSGKIETPKLPSATPEDWRKAVEATYEKSEVKSKVDGVEEFFACFKPIVEKRRKCTSYAFGKRDAFRKIRFYSDFNILGNNVAAYVSLSDNKKPILLLAPHIASQNSWIFINKLAIMIDGEVVLEQGFEDLKVDREISPEGVQERVDFIVTKTQIEALHKIKLESTVVVRITGEKGYITLDKLEASTVKESIVNMVQVYDALNSAVKDTIPVL